VGVDRDLEFASVSLGLAHDFLPANEEACNPESIVDHFQMLDQFAHTTGRVAPVVSVPEVSPDCGPIHALRPAEWAGTKAPCRVKANSLRIIVCSGMLGMKGSVCLSLSCWVFLRSAMCVHPVLPVGWRPDHA